MFKGFQLGINKGLGGLKCDMLVINLESVFFITLEGGKEYIVVLTQIVSHREKEML